MADLTDKQTKKLIRRGRGRAGKNFLWWLLGFISPLIILGIAAAIVLFAVPVGTFTGNDGSVVSTEISSQNLFDVIMNYQKFSIGDLPIVTKTLQQVWDDNGLDKYFLVNFDALNEIRFDGSTFADGFQYDNYFTITATINGLELGSSFGDLASISAMQEWEVVKGEVNPSDADFNPKLYYYISQPASTSPSSNARYLSYRDKAGNVYDRAFNDDKTRVPESEGKTLYYPALFDISVIDMLDLLGERIGTCSADSLLASVMGVNLDNPQEKEDWENSIIYQIVNGKEVNELATLSADTIYLREVLPIEDNQDIYKIISAALDGMAYEEITLNDLTGVDTNKIQLTAVLPLEYDDPSTPEQEGNETLYKVLLSVSGKTYDPSIPGDFEAKCDTVTVGDLANFNTDEINLTDVLPPSEDNEMIYKILSASTGLDNDKIKVGNLNGLDIDKVVLEDVLPYDEDSEQLYRILCSVSSTTEEPISFPDDIGKITIAKLKKFDSDKIQLTDVLPLEKDDPATPEEEGNETLYRILLSVTGKSYDRNVEGDFEEKCTTVLLGDLHDFDTDKIVLKDVVDPVENKKVFDMLISAKKDEKPGLNEDNLTVGDLNGLDTDNVYIADVVDPAESEDLYNILTESLGKEADKIKLGDLEGLETNNVRLVTVLPLEYDDPLTPEKEGNETLYKILCSVTDRTYSNNAEFENQCNEIVVGDLSNFDTDKIYLKDVLDPADNEDLYKILRDVTAEDDGIGGLVYLSNDEITIGKLNGLDTGKIHLDSVLDSSDSDNDELYKILMDVTGASSKTDITVNDLNGFDTGAIHLDSVLDSTDPQNADLYKILLDVTGKENKTDIKVDDLNGFDTGKIKLDSVLDSSDPANDELYEILLDVTGKANKTDIAVDDLNGFDTGAIKMKSVLDPDDNEQLYKILTSSCGKTSDNLTVDDLSAFNASNIFLKDVIEPSAENEDLYTILRDITGKTNETITVGDLDEFDAGKIHLVSILDPDDSNNDTLYEILCSATNYDDPADITIANLSSGEGAHAFDTGKVKLTTLLPASENVSLYNILIDATGAANADAITIDKLSDFNISDVRLSQCITDDGDNVILRALLQDDSVTIGNLGSKINSLSLNAIYGDDVFTTDASNTYRTGDKYVKNLDGSFTLDAGGTYYISKTSNIWLLFCFEASDVDANGRVGTFTPSSLTFNTLTSNPDSLSSRIMNATIYNLMTCGIVTYDGSASPAFTAMTLQQVIDLAKAAV